MARKKETGLFLQVNYYFINNTVSNTMNKCMWIVWKVGVLELYFHVIHTPIVVFKGLLIVLFFFLVKFFTLLISSTPPLLLSCNFQLKNTHCRVTKRSIIKNFWQYNSTNAVSLRITLRSIVCVVCFYRSELHQHRQSCLFASVSAELWWCQPKVEAKTTIETCKKL